MDRSGVPQGGPSKHEPACTEINNSAPVEPTADAQESSGIDQTSSSADSTKDQCNNSSGLVPASRAHSQSHVHSLSKLALPILAVAAAVLWWLRKPSSRDSRGSNSGSSNKGRGRQQQRQAAASPDQAVPAEEEQEEPESALAVYASGFKLNTQDVALVARPAALEGLTCVAAEHIPIQGASIGCGIPELWSSCPTANSHASIIQKLLHKGISIAGQGTTQPFNYPTLGNNMRNPAARFRVAGGGATGAAAAVAQQQAHVMVGTDWLGSVRIPAACQGLAALVCTPGVHAPSAPLSAAAAAGGGVDDSQPSSAGRGSSGGSSSARSRRSIGSSLECAALAAGDVSMLRRVSDHLALPGVSDLRGELTQVVVAEDLFSLCEQELEAGLLCMKRAVLQWAGQEQAGSVQLLPFLESNCRTWSNLDAAAGGSILASVTTGSGKPLPPILRAITYAAQLLYHHQLAQQYSEQAAAVPQGVLDPALSAAIAAGQGVQQQELDDAWQLLTEVQELLHTAVKHDVVVVVPCIPSAPPRIDAPPEVLQSWLSRCHAFAALTALGGVPSVVVPVGQLPNGGGGPLAVALFGHSRSDTRLVVVAQKLAHAAQAEFVKLVEKRAQDAQEATAAAASNTAGHADSNGTTGSSSSSSKTKSQRQQQQQPEQVDPRRLAKAEKAKARGNDAFKQGKYREAIKSYSDAFKFDPNNPVYLSNRALCYLRLFSFEAAEADCNAVLGFPELGVGDQVKALLRRGTARIHKNELDAAQADFKQVLHLEPNNRQAREELKALADQRRELAEEQRKAMASRISSSGAQHSSSGALAGFPPSIYAGADASQGLGGMDAQFGDGFAAGVGGAGVASPEEFEAMRSLLQSGSLPVVLGDEGQPVLGPRGEPVIVGPGGQQMAVGPAGGVTPYRTRRKKASAIVDFVGASGSI